MLIAKGSQQNVHPVRMGKILRKRLRRLPVLLKVISLKRYFFRYHTLYTGIFLPISSQSECAPKILVLFSILLCAFSTAIWFNHISITSLRITIFHPFILNEFILLLPTR